MRRVLISLAVGLGVQLVLVFLVPDGQFGPCGPIDNLAMLKLLLLIPGIFVMDHLHVAEGPVGIGVIYGTNAVIFAAICYLTLSIVSQVKKAKASCNGG